MRLVVLVSGGLDSTVLIGHLQAQGHDVLAFSVNYGQRHSKELAAAIKVCDYLGVEHVCIDLSNLRIILTKSALTGMLEVPDGHYEDDSMKATVVPNRNMLLLSSAISLCISRGFDGVAYAAHAGDHAIYPDCRPAFAEAMGVAANLCDYQPVQLLRPFIRMSKAEIVSEGTNLNLPLHLTWSCYKGGVKHCGTCGTCVERKEAFTLSSVEDPTEYA